MDFANRHKPTVFADLVFRSQVVRQTLQDYANGTRTRHLLLYGPPGSGKSEVARVISRSRATEGNEEFYDDPFHASDFSRDLLFLMENTWNTQRSVLGGDRGYAVLDEIHTLSSQSRYLLRGFIDRTRGGTLICTTNFLEAFDAAFLDRFKKVEIMRPCSDDWLPRARTILESEGVNLTDAQILTVLNTQTGSGRDFIDMLEDFVHELRQPTQPSAA